VPASSIRSLSPHQLRHGFANRFLRGSARDFVALQALMGHSRPDTTQQYTDKSSLTSLPEPWDVLPKLGRHKRRLI
jgi:Site-specific recombinase XerD